MAVPRPGIVVESIRAAIHPPSVPSHEVDAVLGRHGLVRSGRIRNFALGWRSSIVSVDTPRGRRVVKRYRAGWEEETIRHEHAVLAQLERVGFPAVRAVAPPGSDPLVTLGDARFVVFEFVAGRSMTGRYMTSRARRSLFHHMGMTLGQLHRALDGFVPANKHHLGYATADGPAPRDLEWHIGALRDLMQTSIGRPEERELRDAVASSRQIEERLVTLDRQLSGAELDTGVIHGDFGPHNVIFDAEGRAVVHDFELARVDLRMTDLVGGVSRWRPEACLAYIEGYRASRPGAAADIAALPVVWEQVRLTGAIQSWHTYRLQGGPDRLETARQRMDEALALQRGGAPEWLS